MESPITQTREAIHLTPRRARLHPPLTDIPIGAIVVASTVDIVSAIRAGSGSLSHELYRTGTVSLMVGTGAMVLTIAAGFVDRARVTRRGGRDRKAVNLHAAFMSVLCALCVADISVRRHTYPDAPHTPGGVLALTLACALVMIIGGNLGGKLVYASGVGVAAPGARETTAAPAVSSNGLSAVVNPDQVPRVRPHA